MRTSLPSVRKLSPLRRAPLSPTPPLEEILKPTEEELIYSQLVETYPALEGLVETLDLVSTTTGEKLRRVPYTQTPPIVEPLTEDLLEEIAYKLIGTENNRTQEDIVTSVNTITGGRFGTPQEVLEALLKTKKIEKLGSIYYLSDSTPF